MPVLPDSFHLPLGALVAILPDRLFREPSGVCFGFPADKKGWVRLGAAPQELGVQP